MKTQTCGLKDHPVGKYGPPIYIESKFLPFILRIRPSFLPTTTVCKNCYLVVKNRILEKYAKQQQERSLSITSVTSESSLSLDEFDKMIMQTPQNPKLRSIVKEPSVISSSSSSITANLLNASLPTESQDTQIPSATTSANTARNLVIASKRVRIAEEDEYNFNLSPNATNGTRLPNFQPIARKRPFTSEHKQIMDIYLAGIKGG